MNLLKELTAQSFTTGEIADFVGMSYRQFNDWDSKGVVESERKKNSGWRKFNGLQVLLLGIITSLRESLNISPSQLKNIQDWLMGKVKTDIQESMLEQANDAFIAWEKDKTFTRLHSLGKDALNEFLKEKNNQVILRCYLEIQIKKLYKVPTALLYYFCSRGDVCYLYSDTQSTHYLLDQESLINHIDLHLIPHAPVVLFRINEIVNEFRKKILKKEPFEINKKKQLIQKFRELENEQLNENEKTILKLIREKDYRIIKLRISKGKLIQADVEDQESINKIEQLIYSGDFVDIELKRRDGKIVSATKKQKLRFANDDSQKVESK